MATKKEPATARYEVLRDCPAGLAGAVVELDPDEAALMIRDGMVTAAREVTS